MTTTDGAPRPSEDDETHLWQRAAAESDGEARRQLIERHLPLARRVAASLYARRGGLEAEFVDYLQLATLGLIESVDHYDSARGVSFEAFAAQRVRGAVLNSLESLSETYQQVSLRKRLRAERLESLRGALSSGRPSNRQRDLLAELAEVTIGLALSFILEGSGMLAADDEGHSYRQEFYDGVEERQLRETVLRLVEALPEQERWVVRYHYYQGLGFNEIAGLLGVTKGRISQIHRQALQLLRDARAAVSRVNLRL